MKFTDELQKKINTAETLEEKKAVLAERGLELTDEEIKDVAGGIAIFKTTILDGKRR